MQTGIKIDGNQWIKILDRMELLDPRSETDRGYETLSRLLQVGYSIDHVLWNQSTNYEGIGWFTFVVNKADEAKQWCKVVYGPQSADLISKGAYELYFRKKPNVEESLEVQFYKEMDEDWKAGL